MVRHGLFALWWACLCWYSSPLWAAAPVPAAPNILLVVVDDLGVGDLRSFHPGATVPTPSMDALAAQGMRFPRFYTDSTCAATRAALLTGQHPARLGFHPVARGVAPDVVTLPEWLRLHGYRTHHVGKWHLGELDAAARPVAQGFDTSFGFLNQWFLQGPDDAGQRRLRPPVYHDPWLEDGTGEWRQYQGYLPDILTERAVALVEASAGSAQPWFLWYATPLVHTPLHAPPGTVPDGPDAQYRAMLQHLDHNIGSLLAALDRSGQRDRTVIVLLSDNGAPDKRAGSNAGFAGGKGQYNEGAVRTPLLWVDPARKQPGSLDARAIAVMDIFPTLAARIGHPLPFPTDGLDIESPQSLLAIRDRPLYWLSRGSQSLLPPSGEWRVTEEWVFREKQQYRVWSLAPDSASEVSLSWRTPLLQVQARRWQRDFLLWLDAVSRTPVTLEQEGSAWRASGNDFLRTPLREWDFHVALVPGSGGGEQVIAEQQGIWSLVYQPAQSQLVVAMHGHRWQVPFSFPAGCSLLALNADLYDLFTNLGNTRNPTELRLSVNGREVGRTEWLVDSLSGLPLAEPTWIGRGADGGRAWQGKVSPPAWFHRASVVGEWPYPIDEDRERTALCAQLVP